MSVNHFRLLIRDSHLDRSPKAGENTVLTFLQIAADGRLFPIVAALFASARLIAIQKPAKPGKPPGIRPIAIGTIIRRAVATIVLKIAAAEVAGFLLPQQVSLALAAGTEILIHGFRDVLKVHGIDPDKVLLRVDAKNAFNSIKRAAFLRLVILHAPSAAQLVHALYGAQPFLAVGGHLLRSAEGTQQGDPLGGLLLCLVIQPLVMRIDDACRLDFNGWYADDGNIFGDISQVAEAYRILVDEGPAHNFFLVKDKTSLWSPSMDVARLKESFECDMDADDDGRPDDGVVLVGSPVGYDAFVAEHVAGKAEKVDDVLNLVRPLDDAQIALPLHRACLSVVLFNYIFRTTPPAQTLAPALLLDAQQTRWLDKLLPALPPLSSAAVAQSRLPLRAQGLGLTAPSDAVRPAFLASRLDTAASVARLRPSATAADTALACSTPGADKTALAVDVTVVAADTAPLASAGRSAATRAEDKKRREWAERVADVNAAMKDEGRPVLSSEQEGRARGKK